MKNLYFLIFLIQLNTVFAQNKALADAYLNDGAYEKAIPIYKNLINSQGYHFDEYGQLAKCFQQLKKYNEAENTFNAKLKKFPKNYGTYVDLGYNYFLKKDSVQSIKNYNIALEIVKKEPIRAYNIARKFKTYQLLDYAIKCYESAMKASENLNYELQLARLYGEQGDFDKMFSNYINFLAKKPKTLGTIQRNLAQYVTNNPYDESNKKLKRLLIKRLQEEPNPVFNELLSWIYVQQKEYYKAFVQQKAIYKRTEGSLRQIFELGKISMDNKAFDEASEIFNYIKTEAQRSTDKIKASHYIIKTKIKSQEPNTVVTLDFERFFEDFGRSESTLNTQLLYAHFLAFNENKLKESTSFLKKTLQKRLNKFDKAKVKLELADVLTYQSKFNSALIYLSQIEIDLKNDILSQKAHYKVAQTSYYKGDFHWAKNQLDVLKASTSQLIANDAMKLSLLISNNTVKDSLKLALKMYAKADLLAFQNKDSAAIAQLDKLLIAHKGHSIEDEALFKQASLYTKLKQYDKALANYKKIILINPEDILVDNAYFQMAKLYDTVLGDKEKAKTAYEKIILDFPSSIYYVDAQKRYRTLRGDTIN